jgi:tight adherence protein C
VEGLISILIFAAVMFLVLGIFYNVEYRQGHWRLIGRIKQQMGGEIRPAEKPNDLSVIKNHLLRIVGSLGKRIMPKSEGELSHLRKTFLKAGYRRENTPVIFFGIKAFLAILLPVIFFFIKTSFMKTMTSLNFMLFAVMLALIGFYLPDLWLRLRIARRKEEITKGFPDALDLMVVCVEAGTGLDAAINRVGEEMRLSNKVLSEEFRLLSLELRAGKPRGEALRNLALRTDIEDVNSLMTLLIQTEKFGTSIAQALRVYSDSMRTKRQQKAEELAAKLPVKLVFPLVLFIFPSLFVVIVGPAVIRIVRMLFPILRGQ